MEVYLLSQDALEWVRAAIDPRSTGTLGEVRIAVDEGTLKVKVGSGVWSPPLDTTRET